MEKIIFIEQTDRESKHLPNVIEIARSKGAELVGLFLIPVSLETADWIETQEKQLKEAEARIKTFAEKMAQEAQRAGVSLNWRIVHYTPRAFMKTMAEIGPADIIIVGELDLDPLAEEGIKHLEDISIRMRCPVLSIKTLMPEEATSKKKVLARMAFFGALSAASYFLFFPQIDKLNHLIYMKGNILGALAVMATVPFHAYIYGSFTECIPKILGLEKSAGTHH
ncbi:hypothetical protein G4V39_08500 [Thermosulfuriphilus ammonigenes]|uniref:Uncharacterized protein n=1 Tax=Thermosulfuriphilus ammonigenes TaxID=1936021 RepID=A0A6G7PXJ4_9BACT|nr:hypothetical protein [Thermosulfuriphilus ammonigenes]MBA2849588.1 hypothetical protein [Thermosulfuriphilus ammonigenes]QIJ72307.1 hypothetical protein G4V39_08500 [Thermosulfuriphilus ammonigenes]